MERRQRLEEATCLRFRAERIGDGLRVTGWATEDDLPEAIELPGARYALGVQWHPEADPASVVIASLVDEARSRALAA